MITLGDIFNRIGNYWQWIRSSFMMIKEGLSKLHFWAWGTFMASFAAMKQGYDVIIDLVTSKFTEMQTLGQSVTSNVQAGANGIPAVSLIQNANVIFPIDETLAGLVIILEFWVFCIIFKMAMKLKNLVWFKWASR